MFRKKIMCSVIMGSFLEQIVLTEDEPRPKKKKTTSTIKKTEKPKGCKDIRNFFQNAGRPRSNKNKNNSRRLKDISYVFFRKIEEERNSILT